jgi:O-succinylbenzoic acid--CoA ligase
MDQSCKALVDSSRSYVHLNPSLTEEVRTSIQSVVAKHSFSSNLCWVMSSGTSSGSEASFKLIGLTHEAFRASAEAVNTHLNVTAQDRWYNLLPLFHVGGLGILYRAQSSQTECVNDWEPGFKWNPHNFVKACQRYGITLTSLVPTQVFDLIQAKLIPPKDLRAIVVGGARLSTELYLEGRKAGWPLLPSFGMTEAASQIATAKLESLFGPLESPALQLLSHVRASTTSDQVLLLAGPSLLAGYYAFNDGMEPVWHNPLDALGWYKTQDRALIQNNELTVLSRVDDVIKIRGENVNLASLRQRLETLKIKLNLSGEYALVALPDARLGHLLVLTSDKLEAPLNELELAFNQQSLPYERIEKIIAPIEIPKSSLGKIRYEILTQNLIGCYLEK